MIKTKTAAEWLKALDLVGFDTELRDSETRMVAIDVPVSKGEMLRYRGIYDKKTGRGVVYTGSVDTVDDVIYKGGDGSAIISCHPAGGAGGVAYSVDK